MYTEQDKYSIFEEHLYHHIWVHYVMKKIIVYVLLRVLFLVFISLVFRNWTNKHQSNNLVSAEMVCHSSPHITAKSLIQGAPNPKL